MHNIRVFSQRSAWAPYMRLQELRSNTHLGVTGPQKWPLSLKKGKSGRQKIKSWYFYCPYVFLKCLQCTFWRNQTVSFSGLSSSLTEAIFRSHMRCATPYWTWRQSQRTEELKSGTRLRTKDHPVKTIMSQSHKVKKEQNCNVWPFVLYRSTIQWSALCSTVT